MVIILKDWLSGLLGRGRELDMALDMAQFTPSPEGGYLVGGALRDALLGRPFGDLDWLVPAPERAAREAAEGLGGSAFPLDGARGHWRVVAGDLSRDYTPLGGALEANLRARDYTVNAVAADPEGHLFDPLDGLRDLRGRRLRMVSRKNLRADPLRPLRGVRLAAGLGFTLEAETHAAISAEACAQRAGEVALPAPERVGEELNRLLLSERAAYGVRLMERLGLLDVYLPELALGREVEQRGFHHLNVLAHNLLALEQLLRHFPDSPLSLRWAALLHDLGKPATQTFDASGRYYHFYGHDKLGAELASSLLRRLRQPDERIRRVAGLIRYHMLPLPGSDKEARRFLHRRRALLPDLLKLMVADREAARGPLASKGGRERYRLALARVLRLMAEAPPAKPLLDGREVMALLGLAPGPRVGEAVRFVQEAAAVGDVSGRAEAERALRHYARSRGWTEAPGGEEG
jgi:poly(A) polymerase